MDIYHENDRKQRHSPRGDRETVPLFLYYANNEPKSTLA